MAANADCDAVLFLRARLDRRLKARARTRGVAAAERLDAEIAQLEVTLDELVLARQVGRHVGVKLLISRV